jgi:hypothetical protein
VELSHTIDELKLRIQEETGIPTYKQLLVMAGKSWPAGFRTMISRKMISSGS